ncbi:MAG TPA: MarR family transcriptional regulator [Desulfosporosinus sp.]|nr:MarR family transcriptional regulator [Desulfosporosinus sp.]
MQYSDFKSEMWSVMYLVRCSMQKVIEPVVQSEGLSMIQAFILFTIAVEPVTNISNLCKVLGLNQGNASTMCKSMEKSGLIKRTRSSEDERVTTLSLTKQGETMNERLQAKSEQFDTVFKNVPVEKFQTIVNGMNELNELLNLL